MEMRVVWPVKTFGEAFVPMVPLYDESRIEEDAARCGAAGLPFYPSEPELHRILFGLQVPRNAAEIIRQLERDGLPRAHNLTRRRYLPSVLCWLRSYERGAGRPLSRVVRPKDVPDDGRERF